MADPVPGRLQIARLVSAVIVVGLWGPGCAGSGAVKPGGLDTSGTDSGGTLKVELPSPNVILEGADVLAWGRVEVPSDARLTAAKSMAEAVARAELAKFLRVRVESSMRDDSASDGRQAIELVTTEVSEGALPGGRAPAYGWRRTAAGLTVVARVGVPLAAVRARLIQRGESRLAARLADIFASVTPPSVDDGEQTESGFRFVCQGEGKTAADAMTAARAFCEDKICRLCGVEVESVVSSRETLTEVEVSRAVVERCRRIRTTPLKIVSQSLDCPRSGSCVSRIEVTYEKAQRDRECRRYADERFDDPDQCEALITQFSETRGYAAASFRTRVDLLEQAIAACARIDVRPTPLLNALDERLRRGMQTFTDDRGRAPRYLSAYWLAPHPETMRALDTATTFVAKIELLLQYLRTKPPVLDVIEASLRPDDVLDSVAGFEELLTLLVRTGPDHGYGVSGVHFFALDQIRQKHRRRSFDQPLGPLWDVIVKHYPGDALSQWNRVVGLTWLAMVDEHITDEEWAYFSESSRWGSRAAQMLLAVDDHGGRHTRVERFRGALARARGDNKTDTDRAVTRATKRVLPTSVFVLELEPELPDSARAELFTFEALVDVFRRLERKMTASDRDRFLGRMVRALAAIPSDPKAARSHCGGLAKNLEYLEARGADVTTVYGGLCPCLVEHLSTDGLSRVAKSNLYQRALDLGHACVSPSTVREDG